MASDLENKTLGIRQNGAPLPVVAGKRGRGRPAGYATPERVRAQIKAAMLVSRLQKIAAGEVESEPHQVTAALGLLRKVLPDLQATLLSGDPNLPIVVSIRLE